MNDLLNKISSYHLFNYLLPGCLFAVIASNITHRHFVQQNVLTAFFVYYFYGLVISRVGSLVLEPLLRRVKFVRFVDYSRFVAACKKDPKIDILSESNNMYRTLCSLLVLLMLVRVYALVEVRYPSFQRWDEMILVIALLAMFLFSYRKQTNYINRRVKANQEG